MTTFVETFSGQHDRERVLSDILQLRPGVPGHTLIAHVMRGSLAVLGVHELATPIPLLDDDHNFGGAYVHELSTILCDVAHELVPERTWDGQRAGEITGELITVVCREGPACISPLEVQYWWGWRYSNHLTQAFHGDVYVVTPQGWAALLGEWRGSTPALPPDDQELPSQRSVIDAEGILSDAATALLAPRARECLLCYVLRMLDEFGCSCTLRFARHYRDVRAPRAVGLTRRLGSKGGYCDCEIFLNGYDFRTQYKVREPPFQGSICDPSDDLFDLWLDEGDLRWPDEAPSCLGVRAGSTQPCALWCARSRR